MYKKIIWSFIVSIASIGFILLSLGFYNAVKITSSTHNSTSDKGIAGNNTPANTYTASKNPNSLRILVIGDSVARGTGDEKGKGFSTYIPDYFKNWTPKDITLDNAAADGLQSPGLLELLESGKLDNAAAQSDYIIISIGGNDLRSIRNSKSIAKDDEFKDKQDIFISNLKESIKIIRKNSADAFIIFIGLYNPYEDGSSYDNTRFMNTWNYMTQQVIEEDGRAIFIPTYDMFKFNLKRYISPDGLHPNSEGYKAVSNRIVKSVEPLLSR